VRQDGAAQEHLLPHAECQVSTTVFQHCTLLDCTGADPAPHSTVIVQGEYISTVARGRQPPVPADATVFDCAGRTLMPGLSDAHVHAAIIETDFGKAKRDAPATVAFRIKEILEQTLQAGFTTIRDAFGLDWGFVQATERGYVKGPRILFVGGCLSQTGGHGDWREPYTQAPPLEGIHGLIAAPRICDTPDEMRRAAREMLRMGAHGIKLMAGGGCMSPTDEIEHTQFTVEEMAAACYEACTVGKIALAHVYTPQGIMNAVAAGVRSIEHGNFIDEEAAACMRQAGAFFVPTLTTYFLISAYGEAEKVPKKMLAKINKAKDRGLESLQVAQAAGLKIASGSDVLGSMQPFKSMELGLKAQVLGAHAAILSATKTNAELFGLADEIGTVESGKRADLIVVDGQPFDDISVLQDAAKVLLVMRDGLVFKNQLPG
jgi:imidazolonepropionase-like amidohydrolase